jgi:hypothetical protein
MTSLDLSRANIQGLLTAIDVDEDLGGIGDRPGGVEGMDIPEEGEVSQAAMVQYVTARSDRQSKR